MAGKLQNGINGGSIDVEMKEEPAVEVSMESIEQSRQQDLTDPNPPPQSQRPPAQPEHLSTILPVAAAIPPTVAGAASARPGSMPPQPTARPEKPVAHGGPTRQYLNLNVTPHLLEGMKYLAVYEPEKPLLWLADFLKAKSSEVEG